MYDADVFHSCDYIIYSVCDIPHVCNCDLIIKVKMSQYSGRHCRQLPFRLGPPVYKSINSLSCAMRIGRENVLKSRACMSLWNTYALWESKQSHQYKPNTLSTTQNRTQHRTPHRSPTSPFPRDVWLVVRVRVQDGFTCIIRHVDGVAQTSFPPTHSRTERIR